jgi:hypothetical protein
MGFATPPGKRGVVVHKRATAAGRKYPAYI